MSDGPQSIKLHSVQRVKGCECSTSETEQELRGRGTQTDMRNSAASSPVNRSQESCTSDSRNACLQSLDREAILAQPFKAYIELDKERPFFDALGDFRSHIAKCEDHVATALSEVVLHSVHSPLCLHFSDPVI